MKNSAILVTILLVMLFPLSAEFNDTEFSGVITALMDCTATTVTASYCQVSLPCSAVTVYADSGLPARISFLLADPLEFLTTLSEEITIDSFSFLTSLFSSQDKNYSNPYLKAVYYILKSRNYKESDYIINGSVQFKYPADTTVEQLAYVIANRKSTDSYIDVELNIVMFGNKITDSFDVSGHFRCSINEEGKIVVSSAGDYTVNSQTFSEGVFYY